MARFEGFTGPSYQSLSKAAAYEKTVNYYCEAIEVPHTGKTDLVLYQRPGSKVFATPNVAPIVPQPVRAMLQYDGNNIIDGAIFAVSGNTFLQMNADGSVTPWGGIVNDGLPAQISVNAAAVGQIVVASGGHLYILASGAFSEIPIDGVNFFGARAVAFMDGYFIVLSNTPNRQQIQISALNEGRQILNPDGTYTWSGQNVALLLGQADPIIAMCVAIEYIYFFGTRRGEIWYNTGNAGFPLAIESGAFLEVGTNAAASVVQSGGVVFWIGQDARGGTVAMRVNGLAAIRISTHAVEAAWAGYATTNDCICYPLTWNGHSLIRYIFPTGVAGSNGTGWEYDITESARLGYQVWTEINFTDTNGVPHAPVERAHCFAFGKHLIGSGGADNNPGGFYELDEGTYADCVGNPFGPLAPTAGLPSSFNVILEIAAPAGQTLLTVNSVAGLPALPFLFVMGNLYGQYELCLCTSFSSFGSPSMTVVRGAGGTVSTLQANHTAIFPVTAAGYPMIRDHIVRLPFNGNRRQFLDKLEFLIQSGVGADSGQGSNPSLLLRVSRDGGNTWGREIKLSMGVGGAYAFRVIANRLGSYRDGAIWLRIADPVFAALVGAEHYIRQGGS